MFSPKEGNLANKDFILQGGDQEESSTQNNVPEEELDVPEDAVGNGLKEHSDEEVEAEELLHLPHTYHGCKDVHKISLQ